MKIRLVLFLIFIFIASACSEYSCPTYGSSYVYTPKKTKAPGKSKPIKRAEQ